MMKCHYWALASLLVGGLAIAGFGVAAYYGEATPTEVPASLTVDRPDRNLGPVTANQIHELDFMLQNAGDHDCRVVGAEDKCGAACCFLAKLDGPVTIPARGSLALRFTLELRNPGPFESTIEIYVDDAGVRPIVVSVRGEAIERDAP